MITLTHDQRRILVDHAMACNRPAGDRPTPESAFADVIVDLAMERPIADQDSFVQFLWHRVASAVKGGVSPTAHVAWSTAVELLDLMGENLDDIFTGRPAEPALRARPTAET